MRNRRGNILMVAIFMAVFLFFLSVALVTQNRMDIVLALSADHRLGADMAARAGANYALGLMRSRQDWEGELSAGNSGELAGGANWSVTVKPYADPQGSPFLFEIDARGRSGVVAKRQRTVVEEIRMAAVRDDEVKPHLFTLAISDDLLMLGPDFKWRNMGALPRPGAPLKAAGGKLVTYAPKGSAQPPPALLDNLPLYDEAGEQVEGGPLMRIELVPPGEHLIYLNLDGGVAKWEDIPDPGPELGRWKGLVEIDDTTKDIPVWKIYPDEEPAEGEPEKPWDKRDLKLRGRDNGAGEFEILTVETETTRWGDSFEDFTVDTSTKPWTSFWDSAKTTSELTLEWEQVTGPQLFLEWYSIDGKEPAVVGNKIYVHGTHYFYGHVKTDDNEYVEYGTSTYDSIVYSKPAILVYDLDEKEWSRVNDMMKVEQPDTEPQIFLGDEPSKDKLAANQEGEAFAYNLESENEVLKARPNDFQAVGFNDNKQRALVGYRGELLSYYQPDYWGHEHRGRSVLRALSGEQFDPRKGLALKQPELVAPALLDGTLDPRTTMPAFEVDLGLYDEFPAASSWGDDLYAAVWVKRTAQPPSFTPFGVFKDMAEHSYYLTLSRYNGEHWQLWPQGLQGLLHHTPASVILPGEFPAVNEAKDPILVKPSQVVVAGYESELPDLNHYPLVSVKLEADNGLD